MRQKTLFNKNWLFILDDERESLAIDTDYTQVDAIEQGMRAVQLPHDWSMDYPLDYDAPSGGGGGYARTGLGWYRKHFDLPEVLLDRKYELYFEGVYQDSTVYVNGQRVGGHGYGYTSFYCDMTEAVTAGENVVAVRVNNALQPNSRWYSGSGIVRDVHLVETGSVHFDHFGVRACTNGIYPEQDEAQLQIRAQVSNESGSAVHVGIRHRLLDASGKQVSVSGVALSLQPGESSDSMVRPSVSSPHLWTDEDPYLYTLESSLELDGEIVDTVSCRTGIRTVRFDAKEGFLLNGKTVKIKGMCLHRDCGLTGAVGYRESWERRLRTLKEMGCNAVRSSTYPPVENLLDLCDELGIFMYDEAYDEWLLSKNKNQNYYSEALAYGSAMFFPREAEQDVVTMVRRDFNHPSVIIWGIGNEIPEQSSIDGVKILRWLQDICHREDSSRQVTSSCDNIAAIAPIRTLREFENALDVVGYNYVGRWRERAETFFEEDHFEFPDRPVMGTENPSAGGTRGDYTGEGHFGGKNYPAQTLHHEALWRYEASHKFVSGDFLWTGIDYLGETRGEARGAGCGPIDTAGFKKDTFYYFKSIWNKKETTLHLLPHWNWQGEEGSYKQVVCYTNCDEVKLYINGKYVGSRGYQCPRYGAKKAWNDGWNRKVRPTTNDLHLVWDVVYEPGELKAEGYVNGELSAVETVQTTGKMIELRASLYEETVPADGIAQIELAAYDENGLFVPDACPMIRCEIEGPAHLIGMDGGDLRDISMYSLPQRKMFNGLLLAVIMADAPGEVKVKFETEEGMTAQIRLGTMKER